MKIFDHKNLELCSMIMRQCVNVMVAYHGMLNEVVMYVRVSKMLV